jgi:hypothetical protein
MKAEVNHLILLGDSIFDNKSYVGRTGKDVITHLRESIPSDWQAQLLAIDGSLIKDVSRQLSNIPAEATHLIVSVGGNNAIMNADILQMQANSSAEVLETIAQRIDVFEAYYHKMLKEVLAKNLPVTVCTIYYPNFDEAQTERLATTALTFFNDAIVRQAILAGVPILDLRFICNEKSDYANEIEPSDSGGRKIALKILEAVVTHDFSVRRTQVFV